MAQQYNANSIDIGFGGDVAGPLKHNWYLDQWANSINKIDERHQKAVEKMSAIDLALSQIELDSSEDEWKANYAQNIRDQINEQAKYGDYSTALTTATMLAGTAVSSPELLGRAKAHADREQQLKELKSRNDLNSEDIEAWNLLNPYKYQDKTDSQGIIIGGSKWEADYIPKAINEIDEIHKAISLIAPYKNDKTTGSRTAHTKSDGSSSDKGGTYTHNIQELSKERIKEQLKNYVEQNPELANWVEWTYKKYKTLYNNVEAKLNNPGLSDSDREDLQIKANRYKQAISDRNGIVSKGAFDSFYNRYETVINNFAYTYRQDSTNTHTITSDAPDNYGGYNNVSGALGMALQGINGRQITSATMPARFANLGSTDYEQSFNMRPLISGSNNLLNINRVLYR